MRAALVVLILLTSVKAQAVSFTIVDALNGLDPRFRTTTCCPSGLSITPEQWVGPRFTLPGPTRITEIGGFIGFSQNSSPLTVNIRPQINGAPDISSTLGTFTLSQNFPFIANSAGYESVSPNLSLETGTYYAMFESYQATAQGGLLIDIQEHPSGISYIAGSVPGGKIQPLDGLTESGFGPMAVRILGEVPGTVPLPDMLWPTLLGLIGIAFWVERRRCQGHFMR
jgi:hypothetical protein